MSSGCCVCSTSVVVDLVVLLVLAVGSENLHGFFGSPGFRLHRLRFPLCVFEV